MSSDSPSKLDDRVTQEANLRATRHARWLVVVAAIMWSTSGFFAKAPTFQDWPEESKGILLAFWRAAFACVVLVPMVRRPEWSWKLLPMAVSFVLMNITYLTAMVKGDPANAIWMQNTAPVWVLFVGVFVFRESARGLDFLLVALCGAGVGVILYFEALDQSLEAVLYGLASGVFYAGVVLSLRQLRAVEAAWLVSVNHVATAVVLAPYVVATGVWPHDEQWFYLAAFGILQMGLPYLLFARGLRRIPGHEAAGFSLLEPLLVPVWVYVAWHGAASYEPPSRWTLIGGGCILVGLLLRYAVAARKTSA